MGFGASRTEARQIVRHNGILVNGKRVNIPSYRCARATSIEVAEKAKEQLRIKAAAEAAESRGFPEWIEVDAKALKGTFKAMPAALRAARRPSTNASWSSCTRSNRVASRESHSEDSMPSNALSEAAHHRRPEPFARSTPG